MKNYSDKYKITFFKNKKIIKNILLSTAFGAFCEKVTLDNSESYIVKGFIKKNNNYDSIFYEGKSLTYMYKKFPKFFPKVLYLKKNIVVIKYINHNNLKNSYSEKDLAFKLAKIHQINNDRFGFKFDTPIGGLKQDSGFEKSWINFYRNKRLNMIFEKINMNNPMPKKINMGIEKILKNLENLIPNKPIPSLIHGELWQGNMLFDNGKLVGLIDPGIYFAHNELEIAYLKWFKYITNDFYKYYSEKIKFDSEFFKYSEIYELYYSLLNVHLWSREYINDVKKLISKFN